MSPLRRHPWFYSLLILAAFILAGEGVWLYLGYQACRRSGNQLALKSREWSERMKITPPSTEDTASGIAEDAARMAQRAARLRAGLLGGERAARLRESPVPVERRDAYFDLEAYVRRMRKVARDHHVSIAAGERFGFAAYVNEGPVQELIPRVFRQRQVLAYLLETLLAAQPQKLTAVARAISRVVTPVGNRFATREPDAFVLDPRWSVKVPGTIETEAYRITFIGETAVLRNWLNQLVRFELPVIVRVIEVEPLGAAENGTAAARPATSPIVLPAMGSSESPIVERAASRFTVTLESLEPGSETEGGD